MAVDNIDLEVAPIDEHNIIIIISLQFLKTYSKCISILKHYNNVVYVITCMMRVKVHLVSNQLRIRLRIEIIIIIN